MVFAEQIFIQETRTCSVCGSTLPATEDYFYAAGAGGYLKTSCIECDRAMRRLRYQLSKMDAPKAARSRDALIEQIRSQIQPSGMVSVQPPMRRSKRSAKPQPAAIEEAARLAQEELREKFDYYLLMRELHKAGQMDREYRLLALEEYVIAERAAKMVQKLEHPFHSRHKDYPIY